MRAYRFVLATLNLDSGGAKIAGEHADASESLAVESKNERRSELETSTF
jgi:hypothetical protein